MSLILRFNIILFLFLLFPVTAKASDMAEAIVKVIDEDGKPVEDANVEICFYGGCLTKDAIFGRTNSKGLFTKMAASKDGTVGVGVQKKGFYASVYHYQFNITKLGQWQPWDKEMMVVLRQKVNPVPMYVRNRYFEIPAHGKEIGFDLMKADWVIPYGQGVQSDFIMRVDRQYKDFDNFDATLTLTFTNKFDGIQVVKDDRGGPFRLGSRSVYFLPRNAPETGYQSKLVKRISEGTYGEHTDRADDNNIIFRVRSEVDEEGKLKRAMYGKILGEIEFTPRKDKVRIGMHYYLNPDYTRNLEYDPEKNLFKSLPSGEGVALP